MSIIKDVVAITIETGSDEELVCMSCATKDEIDNVTEEKVFDRSWVDNKNEDQGEEGSTFVFCCRCHKQI